MLLTGDLEFTDEAHILRCLKSRYENDEIYVSKFWYIFIFQSDYVKIGKNISIDLRVFQTNASKVLMAVNPFKKILHIVKEAPEEHKPHIYTIGKIKIILPS